MKEEHKIKLCELAGYPNVHKSDEWDFFKLKILIEAMWAINRDKKNIWRIIIGEDRILVITTDKSFDFKDYNDSEQQALEAALEYILDRI